MKKLTYKNFMEIQDYVSKWIEHDHSLSHAENKKKVVDQFDGYNVEIYKANSVNDKPLTCFHYMVFSEGNCFVLHVKVKPIERKKSEPETKELLPEKKPWYIRFWS